MKPRKRISIVICLFFLIFTIHAIEVKLAAGIASYRSWRLEHSSAEKVIEITICSEKIDSSKGYEALADCYREIIKRPTEFVKLIQEGNFKDRHIESVKSAIRSAYLCYEVGFSIEESKKKRHEFHILFAQIFAKKTSEFDNIYKKDILEK